MTVLITGGAGYIGSHTAVELLEAGYDIVIVDNFSNSHPEAIERIREITGRDFAFYEIDLLDKAGLEAVFARHSIEAVIHFAGLKAVGESVREPLRYYHINLLTTITLCEVMNQYNVFRMVFSSSATVYGNPERVPISEEAVVGATNPYGRTKQIIEQILQDLSASDPRWAISILRYFNPIGSHPSGRIGEDPNGIPNNLIPYISQVAVGKLDEVKIFGNDYETPDGTGVRDYIHVVDLAEGHLKALVRLEEQPGVEIYNLGTGKGLSVLEMIASFETVSGQSIPYVFADRRSGDIGICYADATKASRELGWRAERGVHRMCQDTWLWQKSNPEGYKEAK